MIGLPGGGLAKGLGRASLVKGLNHLKQSHGKPKSHWGWDLRLLLFLSHLSPLKWSAGQNTA